MKRRIDYIRKILNLLYEALFISLVLIFIRTIFLKEDAKITDVVCVVVSVVLSYIIREFAPSNFLIALLHIIYWVILFFIPVSTSIKYLIALLIIFFLVPASISYARRNSELKPLDDAPWPSILTGIVIYIFGIGTKNSMITNFAYISVIIMLVLYLLMIYAYGVKKYMEQSDYVSGLPISKVLSVNSRVVAFIAILMVFFMIFGRFIDFTALYNIIYSAVTEIISVIAIAVAFIIRLISSLISTGTSQSEGSGTSESVSETVANQSVFGAMEVFLRIAVALILLFLLYKILSRIFKLLLKPRTFNDDIVLEADLAKKDISESRFDKIKRRLYISKEERARNIYKRTILAHKDDIKLNNHITCQDIKTRISESNTGNVDELTDIYEEIRYNGYQVENNLIRRMLKLSREDKKHER